MGGMVVLLVTGALASCQPSAGKPLPPQPPSVTVTMREYRFDHGDIPGGRVVFDVPNEGRLPHRLSLIPLPRDFPPIEVELRDPKRRFVSTLAGVPDVPPGEEGTFAVDLPQGRYAFVCLIVDPDGRSHAVKGMASEFRIP